ncbi:RidA family protein [Nocardia aurantia]|uniref:2-iminobutanoate/2-iminopropanoate deaminase n=1 Tax=Nocardia aurantia TaxID=2585199 RepID=A0A7K0E0W1_9NOCA|nr:RidA family protein [Nocardia aurantia]MQY31448.1 2-iminobutanoate/2-iminopropanoate deaminase [Nocardia aurantia]
MSAPRFPAARHGGGLLFTSGLAAIDPVTMTPSVTDFDEQAAEVFRQLDTALGEAGSTREQVLKLDCYLADRQWFPAWNAAFAAYFPTAAPARTTTVTTLPIDGLLIEIQAIAVAAS